MKELCASFCWMYFDVASKISKNKRTPQRTSPTFAGTTRETQSSPRKQPQHLPGLASNGKGFPLRLNAMVFFGCFRCWKKAQNGHLFTSDFAGVNLHQKTSSQSSANIEEIIWAPGLVHSSGKSSNAIARSGRFWKGGSANFWCFRKKKRSLWYTTSYQIYRTWAIYDHLWLITVLNNGGFPMVKGVYKGGYPPLWSAT